MFTLYSPIPLCSLYVVWTSLCENLIVYFSNLMKSFAHSLRNIYIYLYIYYSYLPSLISHPNWSLFKYKSIITFSTIITLFFHNLQIMVFKKIGEGVLHVMSEAINILGLPFHGPVFIQSYYLLTWLIEIHIYYKIY